MSVTAKNTEEESFIILGSSPGSSLRDSGPEALQLDGNMTSLAFKANFHLSDNISAGSMSATRDDLRRQLAVLQDENEVLRETLASNNRSLREQFLLVASCQEDVMRTHSLHRDKFDETKRLVEKLRTENRKLKEEAMKKSTTSSSAPAHPASPSAGEDVAPGGASLVYEFVASPDEDTLHKLTAQLELVEKQRRQVIVENEKLTWQKESLEHIADATVRERDELRDKLQALELDFSKKESAMLSEIQSLKTSSKNLQVKLQDAERSGGAGGEEVLRRDNTILTLEGKISGLQAELKSAQLRILDMENLRLEVSRQKSAHAQAARLHREQLQELSGRLRDAQTTVFQPVRISLSPESEPQSCERAGYVANVKLYDESLKHLSEQLNTLAGGALDGLSASMELATQAAAAGWERCGQEAVLGSLARLRDSLETQHAGAIAATGQVRATISIFEKIFQDYKELLKSLESVNREPRSEARSASMDALTAALVSRDQELQLSAAEVTRLRSLVATLQKESDERDHLRAQLDVYKGDFEAERASREKLASDKENLICDMRGLQRRNQTLTEQLEEVRKLNPNIFLSATTKRGGGLRTAPSVPAGASSGNMVYTCPKCQVFSCFEYKAIEQHVVRCLQT